MSKLITVSKAKEEVKRLQHFIELAESYEADTIEKLIIKEYAFTNSIVEVTKKLNVSTDYVRAVITNKGTDELLKLIRSGYLIKTKHLRNK